ncbi:MATH domain and coiled-coil domain-containing protein [Senna tora]|uniref:MATH domain and coiled-coil domain-containing protein n=1 Tax=Senna tora TaxID=362788 RepID=A0A835CNH0_9FABA|nr:MATH domain and coiled-coil domain-containing protein [Senna tora]
MCECEATTSIQDAEVEAYTSYKGMLEISEENLAYLEAGLKRHPQVLEWLIPKRRRTVLASTSFTLFAEVTRLLRTTRRCELRQDVRDYIRDCCTSLQALAFDASWLRYVHTCLDECGPIINNPLIIQQTEAKASSLKAQLESLKNELASFEASLVSLHHHNSRLYDFIES